MRTRNDKTRASTRALERSSESSLATCSFAPKIVKFLTTWRSAICVQHASHRSAIRLSVGRSNLRAATTAKERAERRSATAIRSAAWYTARPPYPARTVADANTKNAATESHRGASLDETREQQ
jgi:hypothetical protein